MQARALLWCASRVRHSRLGFVLPSLCCLLLAAKTRPSCTQRPPVVNQSAVRGVASSPTACLWLACCRPKITCSFSQCVRITSYVQSHVLLNIYASGRFLIQHYHRNPSTSSCHFCTPCLRLERSDPMIHINRVKFLCLQVMLIRQSQSKTFEAALAAFSTRQPS